MSSRDALRAIEAHLATNWTVTPIRYENVPFRETATAYVALVVRDGEGNQISLGTPAVRRWPGIIIVQVFVPEDSAQNTARDYADQIGAFFDRATLSQGQSGTIFCRVPSWEVIGVRSGWFQVNVTIPYHRDRQY